MYYQKLKLYRIIYLITYQKIKLIEQIYQIIALFCSLQIYQHYKSEPL